MPPSREIKTCERCRSFKRSCDQLRPSCTRCANAGVRCSFEIHKTVNLNEGIDSAQTFPELQISEGAAQSATALDDDGVDELESGAEAEHSEAPPEPTNAASSSTRLIRKRKRNCLSCLRCHRLKVKCDKELPCGRCKSSGNRRECYYSYNKGRNEGKFSSSTAPTGTNEDESTLLAPWQVQHKVRGSSHWRDLMAKVNSVHPTPAQNPVLT